MNPLFTITAGLCIITCLEERLHAENYSLSLSDACKMGIERNADVRTSRLEKEKLRFQTRESQSRIFPHLEGYSSFSYYYAIPKTVIPGEIFGQTGEIPVALGTTYDWSSGFKVSQVIFNLPAFTAVKLAKHMEEGGGLTLQQKKEEAVYRISQMYRLCKATDGQIALSQGSTENIDKLLSIAKLQKENGVIRGIDYSRIMVNKLNLQTRIANLLRIREEQIGSLKCLLGLQSKDSIALTDSLDIPTPPEILEEKNRIELQLLDHQLLAAALALRITKQSYAPSLAAFAQHYYQAQRDKIDFFTGNKNTFFKSGLVGLSFSLPIFDGCETYAKARQSEIGIEELRIARKSTQEYLHKEYEDAARTYATSLAALSRQKQAVSVAQEAYDVGIQDYRQGVAPLSDLLLSESGLTEARLEYINALFQLNGAALDLKKAKGALLDK
jgi:outer membrane protein